MEIKCFAALVVFCSLQNVPDLSCLYCLDSKQIEYKCSHIFFNKYFSKYFGTKSYTANVVRRLDETGHLGSDYQK